MAKTIKKHWDIILVVGAGLFLAIVAMLAIDIVPSVPSVEAATTSATTVAVSATVASSITLTIAGVNSGQGVVTGVTTTVTTDATSVAFGTVSDAANQIAAHDLTVSTNATNGYTTNTKDNQVLTSGGDTITDWTGTNATPTEPFASPGTEAFGYTTDDILLGTGDTDRFVTTTGGMWAAFEVNTDREVAYYDNAVQDQTTRIGYQIGVAATTEAGTYTNTVTYTAVGSF